MYGKWKTYRRKQHLTIRRYEAQNSLRKKRKKRHLKIDSIWHQQRTVP